MDWFKKVMDYNDKFECVDINFGTELGGEISFEVQYWNGDRMSYNFVLMYYMSPMASNFFDIIDEFCEKTDLIFSEYGDVFKKIDQLNAKEESAQEMASKISKQTYIVKDTEFNPERNPSWMKSLYSIGESLSVEIFELESPEKSKYGIHMSTNCNDAIPCCSYFPTIVLTHIDESKTIDEEIERTLEYAIWYFKENPGIIDYIYDRKNKDKINIKLAKLENSVPGKVKEFMTLKEWLITSKPS